jgi:NosR/NirI family nitrous oxide reductase transcriptional regulator
MTITGMRGVRWFAGCMALMMAMAVAHGATIEQQYPQVRSFFPGADRFGSLEGEPPSASIQRGSRLLGYVFLTADVVQIPAYSGKPINTLVAFDVAGRIVGIQIVQHEEPILVVGITEEQLAHFVGQYRGKSVYDKIAVGAAREGYVSIDTISGATITVMVENATVMQAVRRVAEARGLSLERVAAAAASAAPLPAAAVLPAISNKAVPAQTRQQKLSTALPRTNAPSRTTPVPTGAETEEEPVWLTLWRERIPEIAILMAGLGFLTLLLVFQDWLARHPTLLGRLRTVFLVYTLIFLGWYALAQLSVVNVLTFVQAAMHGFQWQSFLIDPLLFILWSFVAMTLLLWGRGVYCGWLCPFGALQELSFKLGQRFRIRSFDLPQMVHERLWALKYIILLSLFGLSLQSLAMAQQLAEVEPFKTAITLRFLREWGFVLYAAGLVVVGLFNRKFFCKYLCALGAALTIAGKFRIFDWLRRHRECGRPCQVCAIECEVQAIKKNGEINPNECHYCLDCQVTYWNEHKCPPLVEKRKRREKGERARAVVGRMEQQLGPSGIGDIPVRTEPPARDADSGDAEKR